MFPGKGILCVLASLLFSFNTWAHGPIPVPVEIVENLLATTAQHLQRHEQVYGINSDQLQNILSNDTAPTKQKVHALIILAGKPKPDASKWYEHYKTRTDDLSIRYAVLYLGAMLGKHETRDAIIDLLKNRPGKKSRFADEARLLRGLVELTNADEFIRITDELYKPRDRFFPHERLEQVRLESQLYKGNDQQRAKAAYRLMTLWRKNPVLTEAALQYMIQKNDATPYLVSWRLRHPVLLYFLNRLGYTIQLKAGNAKFMKATNTQFNIPAGPDGLAKKLVRVLGADNRAAFENLLATPNIYKVISDSGKNSQPDKAILDSWQQLQHSAKQRGIDLSQAQFKSANYQVLIIPGGMRFTPVEISFLVANRDYRIRVQHCMLIDGQWHISGPLQWL